ncbi:hypothetical protein ARC90_11905 [Escherichia coli]|nr:hypothetical protein ARC90_11905 [Escherichia coli]KUG94940.1 hypothetical protein ARC93_18945 [Escherichia coli]
MTFPDTLSDLRCAKATFSLLSYPQSYALARGSFSHYLAVNPKHTPYI